MPDNVSQREAGLSRSSNYYSSSLLSAYLSDPESVTHNRDLAPEIRIVETNGPGHRNAVNNQEKQNDSRETTISDKSLRVRDSRISTTSSISTGLSLRSSVSDMSEDLDLQSVKMTLENLESAKLRTNKFKKLKQRLLGEEKPQNPTSEDERFFAYVILKLKTQYYQHEKGFSLEVNWSDAAEVFFFGDSLDHLFADKTHLLNYLIDSSYELGEVRFSNLSRYHDDRDLHVEQLLENLWPRLVTFNEVLDQYAVSDVNIEKPELFEVFSNQANHYDGLCIPLAISMFGNWLLSFNKDKTLTSNYQNTLILDYFRKAARLSLVLRKARILLEQSAVTLDKKILLGLRRYWDKDNQNALSTSLYGLAEFYQFSQNYDVAVTLWELNCHLTGDSDLGHLAILGLTDGFGLGNRCKEHNRFGKKSKTNKFNTKRRIAHLYRILMKSPGFNEYGVCWATKEKYD
ncbi:hypothetical protein METBIDRAFT_46474 [Metschnikowia bicuspidata var. bicuspidata NRRL YB-4993]|uniref:Uncharacterized protein n=1 Tax=Metschnikowia bicuspidata var. bicuspidata NRRL YB-4993 TaxID=869754 RepID=A0A1A0H5Z7_9ASCO|nr:hypothetical protein METBIDRAFT_46474 [Metschnikowia bicuspidata var. bicuspidata NRRL YB-4993]OBA19380.1 hypothetical protein METBIDRAFT_46474 [Metschnikowia bicuspidata var. bicuspidata NRRL YB-4993]